MITKKIITNTEEIDIQLYCLWNFLSLFLNCTFCDKIENDLNSFLKSIENQLFSKTPNNYEIRDQEFYVKTIYEEELVTKS